MLTVTLSNIFDMSQFIINSLFKQQVLRFYSLYDSVDDKCSTWCNNKASSSVWFHVSLTLKVFVFCIFSPVIVFSSLL